MTETALARHDDKMRALAIPKDVAAIWDIAEAMYKAGLVPTSIKTVDCAFLAMMKGAEYGLLPQQALAGFYVIGNIAHPYGTCLNGIVRSAPSYEAEADGCIEGLAEMEYMAGEDNPYKPESVGHAIFAELQRALRRRLVRVREKLGKGKDPAAYFCGWSVMKRKTDDPACVLFDTFDAQRGDLLGKGMWGKWPTRMYMHRAATFARRDIFADALMGLDMTYEEAIDLGTQLAPAAEPSPRVVTGGRPSEVLTQLSRQPVAATATEPPVPQTKAEHAEVYKVAGGVPTADLPLESEEPLSSDDSPPAPGAAPTPTAATKVTGKSELAEASAKVKAAGHDPAVWGREIVEAMFGAGIPSKDLQDADRRRVAAAMLGKLEDLTAARPDVAAEGDPSEF